MLRASSQRRVGVDEVVAFLDDRSGRTVQGVERPSQEAVDVQIEKGKLCFVTVRAVNRSFRFVPKRRVRKTRWYCLAVALECGSDQCIATCAGNSHPIVMCGNACQCVPCW
jgi:hypothetical protein